MEGLLRQWRQDAINKHQYDSAIFIGDKLLALTNDPKDAFWLAQVHFSTGNYTRAQTFLAKHDLVEQSPSCRYLAAHCHVKQLKFDEALAILGEQNPTHLVSTTSQVRRKLQHTTSITASSHPTSPAAVKSSPAVTAASTAAVPIKEAGGQPEQVERSKARDREDVSDLKFEAAMCYLRGICYAKQNAFDRAKECYQDAVRIDVQCFEAFDQLMKNHLMSPAEEWAFLESLDFDSIPAATPSAAQEAAQFVKMLYTTRLSKYRNPSDFTHASETLSTHYGLAENHDLLLAKADLLFVQCRFKEALAITSSTLEADEFNFAIYPLHLACLHELGQINILFYLSHRLADLHPDEPVAWLAVGVYYLSTNKIAEARRFFSKASMMDPHFGPAWIGFAHTFAAEGEHDQAISAYSTAARLFQGTHLPQLFLGMQNLQLNNLTLAQEYLTAAHATCPSDPLLLNELGVVYYQLDHLGHAIKLFVQALAVAGDVDAEPKAWIATRANLGHAYRRQGQWEAALAEFDEVLRQDGKDCSIFCAKGLVLLEMGRPWEAVCAFHEALGIHAQDPIATDLLSRALEELAAQDGDIIGGASIEAKAGASSAMTHAQSGAQDGIDADFDALIRRKRSEANGAIRRVAEKRRLRRPSLDKGKGRAADAVAAVSHIAEGVIDDSMMDMSDNDSL